MRNLRDNKGFTLIELMIVVVIIGILAAIAIPKFTSVSTTAKQAEAAPIMKQICSLAEAEFLKQNSWPSTLTAAAVPGWEAPTTSRFGFSITGGGSATDPSFARATPNTTTGAGLQTQQMNCSTKEISAVTSTT